MTKIKKKERLKMNVKILLEKLLLKTEKQLNSLVNTVIISNDKDSEFKRLFKIRDSLKELIKEL